MPILIADDSEVIRMIVRKALQIYGYENVLEAKDGDEALSYVQTKKEQIQLCVIDVNMPNMDGIELTEEIRKILPEVPIIMLTTETAKQKISMARDKGANGWVVKPFETEKFMKMLELLLKPKTA